ncbi:MAG: hypothetical protein ACOX6D_03290 [Thermoguttaceae bacterium]|jgi:hypothetical protein
MAKLKGNTKSVSAADMLTMLMKHYFWIVLPILVIVAFFLKSGAQGKIKTEYETDVSSITGEKKAMDDIAANPIHPNRATIEAIQEETESLSRNVYGTWNLMYNEQKKRNKWPRRLSQEFLKIVENAKFESPIGIGKPYILEDYAGMMSANLPQLLIDVNRRRYQVRCYQFVREEGSPPTGRFEPVYIDKPQEPGNVYTEPLLYLFGQDGRVYRYHESKGFIEEIRESALRQRLSEIPAAARTEYWVETDPMITDPNNYVSGVSGDAMAGLPGMMRNPSSAGTSIPGEGVDPVLTDFNPNEYLFPSGAIGNNEILPGLPTLESRSRQVGNVDWQNPEIFRLLNWREAVPRSIEVWYLQEDLWVYQALLRVVMRSNGILSEALLEGTTGSLVAAQEEVRAEEENLEAGENPQDSVANNIGKSAIKCIEQLMIGQEAAASWSEIKNLSLTGIGAAGEMSGLPGMMPMGMPGMTPGGAGAGMPPMGMPPMGIPGAAGGPGAIGGMPPMMPGMPGAGSAATGGVDEAQIRADLRDNRYLNASEEPLASNQAAPFAEFKRMPIIMKLIVDQRRIPEILVNCANGSMPIDVRHVRIAPDNASSGGSQGAAAMGTVPGAASGGVSLGRSALGETSGYGSDAIRISIYGIINIFNAPDPEVFGTGMDDIEKQAGSDADTTATADTNAANANAPNAVAAPGVAPENAATPVPPAGAQVPAP